MSLDVYLQSKCEHCGHTEEHWHGNITHNLGKMAEQAGLYEALWHPDRIGIIKANQLIPFLNNGCAELRADPEKYKQYNPKNGWGNYENLYKFANDYLRECYRNPEADVITCT